MFTKSLRRRAIQLAIGIAVTVLSFGPAVALAAPLGGHSPAPVTVLADDGGFGWD